MNLVNYMMGLRAGLKENCKVRPLNNYESDFSSLSSKKSTKYLNDFCIWVSALLKHFNLLLMMYLVERGWGRGS